MPDIDTTYLRDELYDFLKRDDQALDFLFNHVLDGVWYTDLEQPSVEWLSPSYKALFGYEDHEIANVGEWWRTSMFPEDVELADENFRKAVADPNHSYEHVVRFRHKDGRTIWVHCRGYLIRDVDGKPIRMLGCHVDATRLMQIEQIGRFGTIIENCVSGIYLIDAETLRFIQVNGGARRRLGYTMAELSAMTPLDICPGSSRATFEARVAPLRRRESPFIAFEATHRCKDGSTYPVDIHYELLETSARSVFLAFVNDISEKKRHANELAATQEIHQIILNSVSDGVASLEAVRENGRIVDFAVVTANHAMRRQFSLYKGPLIGARVTALMPEIALPEPFERLLAAATSDSGAFTAEIGPGGGTSDWLLVRANRSPLGGLSITCINITAAKERELSLCKSNAALKRFSAIVSHDLQAPLRHIGLFAEMLAAKLADSDRDTVFLSDRIRSNVDRMQRMIAGLLDYTTVAYAEIRRDSVDLNLVLADVLRLVEADVAAAGATVTIEALPTVRGDRDLLTRLFQNLVANALKYRSIEPPRLIVAAEVAAGRCELSVSDNGIGIDPRFADRIFDVFSRLHRDEIQYSGMGIGLAICRQIVESHKGEIWLDVGYESGTRFCLTLPAD
jgi:PAS domain S-box-containing protein